MAEVKFTRKSKIEIDSTPVEDGQILFSTDTPEIFMDDGEERKEYGGNGSVDAYTKQESDEKFATKQEIPTKLPNPQKLIFTGAVSAEYDGSSQQTINIPTGGGSDPYILPIMSDTQLGGGKAVEKTDEDVPVAVDPLTGQLFVPTYPENTGGGGGLSQSAKDALINCFNHVAWIDENGGSYVQTLQNALDASTTSTVVSITANYSGGSVASGSDLLTLKENLVVTATYDDGTEIEVINYTLSGSIVEGENTITVTYRKATTTFTVTGLASYTITYNLTNVTSSSDVTAVVAGEYYTTTLSYDSNMYDLQSVVIAMGGVDVTSDVYGEGTILITEVTGDVVITAIANEPIVNEAVLLEAGTTLVFVNTEGTTISSINYGHFGLVTDVATSDSVAKITITNNTGEIVAKNTSFYAGQTDGYTNENYVTAFDSELVYTTSGLGIEDGNSITFEAKVKKGYLLMFTSVANCDITVYNVITDESYDTDEYVEYSTSIVDTGSRTVYSDDGSTPLATGNYTYTLVSDNAFEVDTDVIITFRKTENHPILWNHQTRYVGCFTDSSNAMYYAKSFTTQNSGFPTYGYKRLTYTVKAGYKLALNYSSERSNYDADVTFKSKVV